MILKILGGGLVLFSSCSIGHAIGRNQEIRTCELSELLIMINLIKSEMKYAVNELPEIFADIAPRLKGSVAVWCGYMAEQLSENQEASFEKIWDNGIKIFDRESRLCEGHMQYIKKLGKLIGHMDVDAQLAQLELLFADINHEYEIEREKTNQIKKLAGSMGILGGIFLVIIMI